MLKEYVDACARERLFEIAPNGHRRLKAAYREVRKPRERDKTKAVEDPEGKGYDPHWQHAPLRCISCGVTIRPQTHQPRSKRHETWSTVPEDTDMRYYDGPSVKELQFFVDVELLCRQCKEGR